MFLCFCQLCNSWHLHPLLGPYPKAYIASQLRSLRRAPADLITGRITSLQIATLTRGPYPTWTLPFGFYSAWSPYPTWELNDPGKLPL